jgi:type VI secretion system protein ImpM
VKGAANPVRVGFFGKLPSRGDFVRVGLSRACAGAWDQWLRAVMPAARRVLGQGWGEAWSSAPVWRFSFAAGQCGATPVSGLWLPSLDRVGRPFPLLIAAECAAAHDGFLDAAERIGRGAIRDSLAPDSLEQKLRAAPQPPSATCVVGATMHWWRPPKDGVHSYCSETWPDADVFLGMLTT